MEHFWEASVPDAHFGAAKKEKNILQAKYTVFGIWILRFVCLCVIAWRDTVIEIHRAVLEMLFSVH